MRSVRHHAEITLDESWRHRTAFSLETRRLEKGIAWETSPGEIESTTDFSGPRAAAIERSLFSTEVLENHRDELLEHISRLDPPAHLSARVLLSHVVTPSSELLRSVIRLELPTATGRTLALVTSPKHLELDLDRLRRAAAKPPSTLTSLPGPVPSLWTGGTGGVLLHEAVGHPAGRTSPVSWPDWLRVIDDPAIESFETRIRGEIEHSRNLLREAPEQMRRASFRDHPMPRMSNLVAVAEGAPFELPETRIEISMATGGDWDPVSDVVRLHVSLSWLVTDSSRVGLAPFVLTAPRPTIAAALVGARGPEIRYPGVLCSEHGQRLPVGTWAPDLLMEAI